MISPKFFKKPSLRVSFNRLLFSSRKEKHYSLTHEIIYAKNIKHLKLLASLLSIPFSV